MSDIDQNLLEEAYDTVLSAHPFTSKSKDKTQKEDSSNPEIEKIVVAMRSIVYSKLLDLVRKIGEGVQVVPNEWPVDQFRIVANEMNKLIAMKEQLPTNSTLK